MTVSVCVHTCALQECIVSVIDLACNSGSCAPVAAAAATAAIAAMRTAEAGMARQRAQAGYAAVGYEGSLQHCCCLLATAKQGLVSCGGAGGNAGGGTLGGGGESSGAGEWWQVVAAAAGWLADICSRAQQCISCKVRGPALRQAEDVFQRVLQTPAPLIPELCCYLAEASAAAAGSEAAAAADAVVGALASMVHAGASKGNASSVADHYPLAQMLTAKLNDGTDHGVDGDTCLLEVGWTYVCVVDVCCLCRGEGGR